MDNAPLSEEEKNQIYNSLTDTLLSGLENDGISFDDSQIASGFILDNLEGISDQSQLLSFLQKLSERFPIFKENLNSFTEKQNEKKDEMQINDAREQLVNIIQ